MKRAFQTDSSHRCLLRPLIHKSKWRNYYDYNDDDDFRTNSIDVHTSFVSGRVVVVELASKYFDGFKDGKMWRKIAF